MNKQEEIKVSAKINVCLNELGKTQTKSDYDDVCLKMLKIFMGIK